MFCVIYSFKVKEGYLEQFIKSWEEMTQLIYEFEGSYGSRLHQSEGAEYIAYAQWPSKKRWEESGANLPGRAGLVRDKMREACHEINTLHKMAVTSDLLKSATINR